MMFCVSCDITAPQASDIKVSEISLHAYGKAVTWEQNDSISVFDGMANLLYQAESAGDTSKFISQFVLDEDVVDLYALYPYSKTAYRTDNGLVFTLPSVQDVTSDPGNALSCINVAYTDDLFENTYLHFKEICSYIKFSLGIQSSVVKVTFEGGQDEFLAGDIEVAFSSKEPQSSIVDGTNSVSLSSGNVMSGTYYVCLLPTVLQKGLKVTFYAADGACVEKKIVAQKTDGKESALVLVRGRVNREVIDFGNPFKTSSDDTQESPSDNPDNGEDNPSDDNSGNDNSDNDTSGDKDSETDKPSGGEPGKNEPTDDDKTDGAPSEIGSEAEGYYVVIKDNLWN